MPTPSDIEARKGKRSIERPYLTVIAEKDPKFHEDKRKQPEYEFSNGRKFTANPTRRGVYQDQRSDFNDS